MKTSKILLTSLLAAAAMSTVPAWAETTVDGTTYSGNIYTWANTATSQADLANGAWKLSTWSDSGYSYGDAITDWSKKVQPLICSVPAGSELNTIRFDASVGSNSNMKYTFTPLAIGGIIVESGASDFAINASGGNRAINLGRDGKTGASTFHESFTLNTSAASGNGAVTIAGTQTWTIDSGKTFTINSGAYAITQSGTLTVSGEGTAKFTTTGGVAFNGTVSVDSGATLDLSGAKVALTSAIANSGTVTVNTSTVFALAGLTGTKRENTTTFTIVDGGTLDGVWTSLTESNVDFSGATSVAKRGMTIAFSDTDSKRTVSITSVAGELVWNSENTSGNWNYTTDNTPWTLEGGSTSFMSGDNATFSSNATITVDSAGVTAGTMTVSAGTVALSGGKVTAASLNVETDAQLNIGNTVSATSLSGAGTVQLSTLSGLSTTFATGTSGWTGAVVLKGIGTGDTATAFNPNSYGVAGSKVVLDGVTGSNFYFAQGSNNALAITPDIEIASGGLALTNGYSSTVYTFSGAISGSGDWTCARSGVNLNQQYVFTGDVSGFSGTLNLANASQVTFGNGGTGVKDGKSVSGTGTITMANSSAVLTYNYSNDVLASTKLAGGMSVIKQGAGSLTLSGDNSSLTGNVNVNTGTLVAANKKALGTGTVTVAENAKLSLGTNAVSIGTLSGAGTIGLATGTTASTLTVNQSADGTFSGSINGELVSLVKDGTGALELSGYVYLYKADFSTSKTTYADVAVNAGTLKISGHAAAGKLSVASGATLGLVGNAASFQSVEISEGAKIVVDMSAFTDKTETFALDLITTSALKYNGEDVSDASTLLTNGVVTLSNWDKSGWTQSLSYTGSTLSLTMTIPEPSTFGLLAGVGALALVAARRRRRAK